LIPRIINDLARTVAFLGRSCLRQVICFAKRAVRMTKQTAHQDLLGPGIACSPGKLAVAQLEA
jgi:hypothetical protein